MGFEPPHNFYSRTFGEPIAERCVNCGRDTSLNLRDHRVVWPEITDNLAPPLGPYTVEEVWSCSFCKKATVVHRRFEASDQQFRDPAEVRIVSPDVPPRELAEEAPEAMRSLYREASVAEYAGAMRGAGALYRAAVEELCRDRECAGANLYDRIEALAGKGVERDLIDDLHEARLLGNWSLHDGLEFSAEEVADVADLIDDAVAVLYVQPAERARLRDARRERRDSAGGDGV